MVEKISAELIGLITFIAVCMVFVIWLVGQLQEFAFFFGFRLSDVVAGDVSGIVTSSAGVPGKFVTQYDVKGSPAGATNPVMYRQYYSNGLACVQSVWSVQINTTDCYSIPSIRLVNNIPSTEVPSERMRITKVPALFAPDGSYQKVVAAIEKVI